MNTVAMQDKSNDPEILTMCTKMSDDITFMQVMRNSIFTPIDDWADYMQRGIDVAKERKRILNTTRVFEVVKRLQTQQSEFIDCGTLRDRYPLHGQKRIELFTHLNQETALLCPCGSILINTKNPQDCTLLTEAIKHNNLLIK